MICYRSALFQLAIIMTSFDADARAQNDVLNSAIAMLFLAITLWVVAGVSVGVEQRP